MSGQKKRKQLVPCSGKLLVGCLETGTAAFLCATCKSGVKVVEYNKCRFSKYFVFEDETTKTICSSPEVRFQKFKFVYGKFHLFCFESVESAISAQRQLYPDMHEVEKIVPEEIFEKEWANERIPFQYSGKHHKLLPRALPKPPDGADPITLLERRRNSLRSSRRSSRRSSIRSNSRSSMGDIDEDKDEDYDSEVDPTMVIEKNLDKAAKSIEDAQIHLLRLKRTPSQTDSDVPGTPPQDEGSMSPGHMSPNHMQDTPGSPRQAGLVRLPPQVAIPPQGGGHHMMGQPPSSAWDSDLGFQQPAMHVGRLPMRASNHIPFQVDKMDKRMFKSEGAPQNGFPRRSSVDNQRTKRVFKQENQFHGETHLFDGRSSSDPMMTSFSGYEEGEVPPEIEYAFRASLTTNEGVSDDEQYEESESDSEYEEDEQLIADTDDKIQSLEAQIEMLKFQKQAQLEVQRDRLYFKVMTKDRSRPRKRSLSSGSRSNSPRASSPRKSVISSDSPRASSRKGVNSADSPRASSRNQGRNSPRAGGRKTRHHRRSRSHQRSAEQSRRGRKTHNRRTHSVDFLNHTQIMAQRRISPNTNTPTPTGPENSPTRKQRRNSGSSHGQSEKAVRLRDILNAMHNCEFLYQERHEYLKWKVDYCPRCKQILDFTGKICIHCSSNNKCCVQDGMCNVADPVVNHVDELPAKLRRKIAKRFSYYMNTIVSPA